uniref:DUF8091 domain-containing protein n=1 Tax=uncultured bacterium contig00015 TaxID=1181506 RepID=A0A806K343_9BACT|nr:hypothetical protein [uncultured bacterium contig00015]
MSTSKNNKTTAKMTKTKPINDIKTSLIGLLNESSLHKTLKYRYCGRNGKTEVSAGEYVADGRRADGEYIEVQTGSFGPLKEKILKLRAEGKVRIIHPIALTKTIEVYDTAEKLLYRRKSPQKGSMWDIFDALLYAPLLPLTEGVTIEIVMADITEKRVKDGKGAWRRKGISIHDRALTAFHESIVLEEKKTTLGLSRLIKRRVHHVPFGAKGKHRQRHGKKSVIRHDKDGHGKKKRQKRPLLCICP